jgi:hypothetical protein
MVEAGLVDCARCGQRILVGEEWDLGHDGTTTSTAASTSGLSIEGVIGARRFGVADLDDNGVWVIGDMSRLNRD